MDELTRALTGAGGSSDRVEKVIQITEQISRVHKAADFIKYDEKLVLEIPETLRLLGAEIERLTAELKTI